MSMRPLFFGWWEPSNRSTTYGDVKHADYLLLVDSFGYLDGSCFMGLFLAFVFRCTGWKGAAIVQAGATLRGFARILPEVGPTRYVFAMVVSMGNDIGPFFEVYPDVVEADLKYLDECCVQLAREVYYVFGGCASVWGYTGEDGTVYDSYVEKILTFAQSQGIRMISGAAELKEWPKDSMAGTPYCAPTTSVSAFSFPFAFDAYVAWLFDFASIHFSDGRKVRVLEWTTKVRVFEWTAPVSKL